MTQRTPGPWSVAYFDQHGQAVVKGEHIEIATCWHHCVGGIEKEMRANAKAISLVPDMIDTLRQWQCGVRDLDATEIANAVNERDRILAELGFR